MHKLFFLQETHLKSESEHMVRAMWGFECIVNGVSSNSKGVGIFFNNNFSYKIKNVIKGSEGNYIIIDIEMLGKQYTLANIYGPSNQDSPSFFENILSKIENMNNENIIIGGDWNIALDTLKDTFRYRQINHPRARKMLHELWKLMTWLMSGESLILIKDSTAGEDSIQCNKRA